MANTAIRLDGGVGSPVNVPKSTDGVVAKKVTSQMEEEARQAAIRRQQLESQQTATRFGKQYMSGKSVDEIRAMMGGGSGRDTGTATSVPGDPDNDGVQSPGSGADGGGKSPDGVVASFGGMNFGRTGNMLRGFSDLKITADTQQKTGEKEKVCYVQRECAKPTKVTATVTLHAAMGCNVGADCLTLRSWAETGKSDYFYLNGVKLFDYKLMLTKAEVTYLTFFPSSGRPMSAQAKLTWERGDASGTASTPSETGGKQGGGYGGTDSTSTGTGGGSKGSGSGGDGTTESKKSEQDAIERWRQAIQAKMGAA